MDSSEIFLSLFPNINSCEIYLLSNILNDKPVCPKCKSTKVYNIEDGKRYKCANNKCYHKFSTESATILSNTNLSLHQQFFIIWCLLENKSAASLQIKCGVTYKVAFNLRKKLYRILPSPNKIENITITLFNKALRLIYQI